MNSHDSGFTLFEVVIVTGIVAFFSIIVITNFSRTRLNLNEPVNLFIGDIRSIQAKAVSGARYSGYNPCGYGVTYIGPNQYALYAGPNAGSTDCATANRNYQLGQDSITLTRTFYDTRIRFGSSFNDIFFEPPDPKTFINNDSSPSRPSEDIVIQRAGGSCPTDCKTVKIYTSGKIEVQ